MGDNPTRKERILMNISNFYALLIYLGIAELITVGIYVYTNYKTFNWKEFGLTLLLIPFLMPVVIIIYYMYQDNKETSAALNNELNKYIELEKNRIDKATKEEVVRNG
jgi:ABC-type sugar transport system permease subunit